MSDETVVSVVTYDAPTFTPPNVFIQRWENLTIELSGAKITEGGSLRGSITVRLADSDVPALVDVVELSRESSREKFIKRLSLKGLNLPDSLLVAFTDFIRKQLCAAAMPAAEIVQEVVPVQLTPEADALLSDPQLIDRITEALRAWGWVGDPQPVLLAYIVFTSRLLPKAMNIAFVSQSSAGKSVAVDAPRALMPADSYYYLRAASEKALIHLDGSFEHRVIIFGEADSIPDDGAAASAIRSLAQDNILAYDVTVQDPQTNQWRTQRIEKPGPTVLITTSTRSLQHQLGTRVLEAGIADDIHQTRLILDAQAREAAGKNTVVFDATPWIALQQWMAQHAPYHVNIPFAEVLSAHVPATEVRMRRDFKQLLNCVRTIAVLHQRQRQQDENGILQAEIADYAVARRLLGPVFDSLTTEGLTPAVRETVEAIREDEREGVSNGELIARLSKRTGQPLAKATVSWRTKRAASKGWLKNLETRRGHSARWLRGDPLPDEVTALPTAEAVEEAFKCSNGVRPSNGKYSNTPTPCNDVTSSKVFECSNGFREWTGAQIERPLSVPLSPAGVALSGSSSVVGVDEVF